MNFSKGEDQA